MGLYTKFLPLGGIKYPNQVAQIKDTVAAVIPGPQESDIVDIPYYTSKTPSEYDNTSEGKVILGYSPSANGDGNAGVEVWAGSIRDANGRKLKPINNNTPVLEAQWARIDEAKLNEQEPSELSRPCVEAEVFDRWNEETWLNIVRILPRCTEAINLGYAFSQISRSLYPT